VTRYSDAHFVLLLFCDCSVLLAGTFFFELCLSLTFVLLACLEHGAC
jgi:hypothetical protein